MTLSSKLKNRTKKREKHSSPGKALSRPIWDGPESDTPNGGITFSLLSRFICCRERFRLLVVEGLRPTDTFNHRMEYGSMFHVCAEAHARNEDFEAPLRKYAQELCQRYRLQQEQVQHWYQICKTQFPIYVHYWEKHKDVQERTPLLQEEVFNVPYVLPSRRIVRLRGKWDSVDLIGKGKSAGIYLQENKSKGEIVEQQIKRQMSFDMQTMIYITALQTRIDMASFDFNDEKLKGVRYNVIRRPLSGGKGSIRQHQPTKSNPSGESLAEFYGRLAVIIREEAESFFMRWKVEILPADIARFRREFLDPILESLVDWWHWITINPDDPWEGNGGIHWRAPYGFFNSLAEGQGTDLDEFMLSGSELGLMRVDRLFSELA